MKCFETRIRGAFTAESSLLIDDRGSFTRLFCENELKKILDDRKIVQINISTTSIIGTIRGMHYQVGQSKEMKFIRCIKGRIWDVFIDLRVGSPTFLEWDHVELNSTKQEMVILPEGVAHGFQTLENDSQLLYLHTASYNKNDECGVRYDDPRVNIKWPLQLTRISDRDKSLPYLDQTFLGIK